ncbi:UNVERIFIED_CONTAM: hypothetical protein GTU68_021612 [Idotea baltica]|nr:hypothetical protein [Idotea baltica]
MYEAGIIGVNFLICNTDSQALLDSNVPNKVQLGPNLTDGRGAGSLPDVGRNSTIESLEEVKQMLGENTKMIFITAGMGGGTGTGGAPVIAKATKDAGILTVGIVTSPFSWEGPRRIKQANKGIDELRQSVDTLIVISNDRVRELYGNLTMTDAFAKADDILTTAAKGIAEIITVSGIVNVDFEDVNTVMRDSGVAIMGSASADGEDRAINAIQNALNSPLLNDDNIFGAKHILLNITSGTKEVLMDEVTTITNYVQKEAGNNSDIIWGNCFDESLGEKISVTLIATGFDTSKNDSLVNANEKKVMRLDAEDEQKKEVVTETPDIRLKEEPMVFVKKAPVVEPSEPVYKRNEESIYDFSNDDYTPLRKEPKEEAEIPQFKEKEKFLLSDDSEKRYIDKSNIDDIKSAYDRIKEADEIENVDYRDRNKQSLDKTLARRKHMLNLRMKSSASLNELENIPAYIRRNKAIQEPPSSKDENISRYTVGDDEKEPLSNSGNKFTFDPID